MKEKVQNLLSLLPFLMPRAAWVQAALALHPGEGFGTHEGWIWGGQVEKPPVLRVKGSLVLKVPLVSLVHPGGL